MKKYLGIIKKETESMVGLDIRILTRFSNSKEEIKKWMKLYPNAEKIMLNNTDELEKFFADFEDNTPITRSEKEYAQKLYESIMNDNN